MHANVRQMAVVTGGSSGIGAIYADRLAARGNDILLIARDTERLRSVADAIEAKHGVEVETVSADLSSDADTRRIEERIRGDQRITWLVNNAGLGTRKPMLLESVDFLEGTMLAVNVIAAHRLAVAAAQRFAEQGHGTIVNISSIAFLRPTGTDPVYAACKSFIAAFSESLHEMMKPKGVAVQCVVPGVTRTKFFERNAIDLDARFAADRVMSAEDLVDAALLGLSRGESVTIPSLWDDTPWQEILAARERMASKLSNSLVAPRYKGTP